MTSPTSEQSWNALVAHLRAVETAEGVQALLDWDEQTMMPPRASETRGRQAALMARVAHGYITDGRIAGWLEALDPNDPVRAACRRNLSRTYARETKVPADLVDDLAVASSEGFAAWIEAKKTGRFDVFRPKLERLLELTRRRADAISKDRHPYEVALEQYDPGTTVEGLTAMFARLREGLVELLRAIDASGRRFEPLSGVYDATRQRELHLEVAGVLGYDFQAGRLDAAEHPFSTSLGAGDVRITTHIHEDDLLNGIGSTVHEVGHALYEQGLPGRYVGTTVNEAASFGLHESQSRLWENFIGRSRPFCDWLSARIGGFYDDAPSGERLYEASNRVERGPIRVASDEVTYDLHIIVRFEIEVALFEGRLKVSELPEAWSARYQEVLGVTPEDDARGVLQDVHWSGGAFGYFPSYTLGNLYAASLGATLEAKVPGLWDRVRDGDFAPVLGFLREHVHDVGHLHEAPEIVRNAVGERDHVEDLLSRLWARHGALYGVTRG